MPLTGFPRWLLRQSLDSRWALLVLVLVAWVVYHPALNRLFVSDQIWYFAELDGGTSIWDGLRHFDYAATRRFWKGDDALWRPLLYAWLAIGNSLFSYHHVWWNMASVGLHVLVALALFRLLIAIRPSPFALPVAVLFLVLKTPIELVLWNHLGGYLLAALFLAIGLRAFVQLALANGSPPPRASLVYTAAFAAAALCHDAMVPIALLAGLLLLWKTGPTPRRLLIALFPVALYSVTYYFHAQRVARLAYVDRGDGTRLDELPNLFQMTLEIFSTALSWLRDVLLPSAVDLQVSVFNRFGKTVAFSWESRLHVMNALLAAALLAAMVSSMSRSNIRRVWPILLFAPGAVFAYLSVIRLGRGPQDLQSVTYYLYFFALLTTIFAYTLVDFSRLISWRAAASIAVLVASIAVNWSASLETTRDVERVNHYQSQYFLRVSRFVDERKGEPGFSFAILDHPESIDPTIELREGYPDEPNAAVHRRRLTEILFRKYYRPDNPKYVLDAGAMKVELSRP